jgi:hypothetical protein
MHLSLKGSMDRQPLTDRLGDRLLAEYGGAAAAYSLRALNGNGDSVVRVRRASDNDEKDFTAEQIELGEMVNWVNSQTVPPLDIGVETSGGRIPVPEGGTSIGIPAAAYSLRNLSTTYTGNVVDVRRSSDNAVASFTASQISNGQMLDFVGGDNTIIQSEDFTSGSWNKSSGRVVITSNSITAPDGELTADLATWSTPNNADSLRQDKSFLAQQYTVSIYLKYNSAQWVQMYFGSTGFTGGHANFDLINGVIGGNSNGSSSIEDVGDGWYRCSVTRTASTSGNTAICATVPVSSGLASRFGAEVAGAYYVWGGQMNEGSIKAYTMTTTGVSGNGFVTKWYDQSGNDNHATQGTAASQPKIVNAGSLVSGGIDFDGVDDGLAVSGQVLTSSSFYAASVMQHDTGTSTPSGQNVFGQYQFSTSGRFQLSATNSSVYSFFANATDNIVGLLTGAIGTSQTLISVNGDGSNAEIWRDGTSQATDTYSGFTPATVNFTIGIDADGNREFNGKIAEIIIYPSDQSDNRTAIEANIGETYGITGIPAYDNTVDGFVETWYDQSGNGNDATQSVAASQPKIVAGGTLATKLGQPSINFTTDSAVLLSDSFSITETESAVFAIWQPAKDSATTVQARHRTLFGNASSEIYIGTPNADSQMSFKRFDAVKTFTLGLASLNTPNLHAFVGTTAGVDYYFNGSSIYSDTATGTNSIRNHLRIGSKQNLATHDTEGYISELIIYDSDQSANRSGIETNINDHYNIY